jgi:hypothetical protein
MNARHDRLPAGPAAAHTADPVRRPARSSCLIPLGCIDIDDLAVELVWSTLTDTVLADFHEVEPRRIGTAVIGGLAEPRFVAQPQHLHWLGYEDREARILQAAVRLFHDRPKL